MGALALASYLGDMSTLFPMAHLQFIPSPNRRVFLQLRHNNQLALECCHAFAAAFGDNHVVLDSHAAQAS